jgi:hypothetical protein
MYSTCLFCKSSLGANEAVEHFPIGRRLAFDSAKGRLWVVCRSCERWNLTPLEERWEAIDECERAYRATKLRVSTEEIGLAKISEGLELVRIGQPLRPEFAAWRYGDQFGKRRRRSILQGTAIGVTVIAVPVFGPAVGLSLGGFGGLLAQVVLQGTGFIHNRKIAARVQDPRGQQLPIRIGDASRTALLEPTHGEAWGLRLSHRAVDVPWWRYRRDTAETQLRGEAALRAATHILPVLNRAGAKRRVISEALKLATENADPVKTFEATASRAAKHPSWNDYDKGALLSLLPAEIRLALEMVSHEDTERRAFEGELYLLEDAWREAEEIASISDNMFLPTQIVEKLTELKARIR